MKRVGWMVGMVVGGLAGLAWAADPVVSNLRVSQRVGTKLVDVWYDVADADGDKVNVAVQVSTNNGATYDLAATALTGDVGAQLNTGTNKHIVWTAGVDLGGGFTTNGGLRLRVDDSAAPVLPADMALIPAGSFQMGDTFNEGGTEERPVHGVYVSAFYMDKYEVTYTKWTNVYAWATAHGYTFNNAGLGKAANHPVHTVNWHDCVKWCNARSEMEGLTACYYTDDGRTAVYRTGNVNVQTNWVKWGAGGYRLPTEAEWEKAARGGTAGKRFPWTDVDTISHAKANYYAAGGYGYDLSNGAGYHPSYTAGGMPYSSPVGAFAANGYGLYDMAGNMWEWCWDWDDGSWYSNTGGTANDTHGAVSGSYRVIRGGSWDLDATYCRVANRRHGTPDGENSGIGFRAVRAPGQ